MSNPLEEYCAAYAGEEKTASVGSELLGGAKDQFGARQLGGLGMSVAMVLGAGAIAGAAKKLYMAATKNKHHREMLEVNPDLAEHHQADPRMFNRHYTSLRNLSPEFASDPVVAGSYMRQMSEMPGNAGAVLVNSIQQSPPRQDGMKALSSGMNIAQRAAPPSAQEQWKEREAQAKLNPPQP